MELDNTSASARIQLLAQGPGLRGLRPGQVLPATVLDTARPGHVTLQINGSRVDARAAMPLVAGQQITVKITAAGPPPALEIVSVNKPAESVLIARRIIEPSLLSVTGPRHGLTAVGVGQRLLAMVIDATGDGELRLQLPGYRIAARSPGGGPAAGDLLELQLVRGGRRPLLALLGMTPSADIANHALRTAVPRQNALPPLMAILGALARGNPAPQDAAPKGIVELARNILDRLPDARHIATAAGLKKALANSGAFLEHRLVQHGIRDKSIGNDFKAELLRLLDALQRGGITKSAEPLAAPGRAGTGGDILPLPPLRGLDPQVQTRVAPVTAHTGGELLSLLLHHVEAALARLQIMQLTALPAADQPDVSFTFELPLRHGERVDVVQLRIGREPAGDGAEDSDRAWTIQLAFDLEHLGPVYVQASLRAEQITTRFWAERAAATEWFTQHLTDLQARFTAAGLTAGAISCHTGKPPGTAATPPASLIRDLEV